MKFDHNRFTLLVLEKTHLLPQLYDVNLNKKTIFLMFLYLLSEIAPRGQTGYLYNFVGSIYPARRN